MKKNFYVVKDLVEMTDYSEAKCYDIIKQLNIKLEDRYKKEGKDIVTFKGRVPVWFFDEVTTIDKNREENLV